MTSDSSSAQSTFDLGESALTGSAPPEVPRLLAGRYRLTRLIGAGGFGEVWASADTLEDREVAIKLLPALSHFERERVRHEITALRWLRLPGVVRLLDEGQEGETLFIVMDRVVGRAFPGVPTPAPWRVLEPLAVQLLETLAQMHRAGVQHLDLKPGNVLVCGEPEAGGRCVVLDFGLARGRSLADTYRPGTVGGTPRYAAPEQLLGRPEAASDLFALGVMLLEALTGRVPDDHGSLLEQVERRRHEALPPLLDTALPERARRLINALIRQDLRDRPEDALAALALLGRTSSQALGPALDQRLPPSGRLDEGALWALFRGPDHFLHLREDGARELWGRTGGEVRRIRAELEAWARNGLARLDEDGLIVLDRVGLDRLAAGLRLVRAMETPADPDAAALLGWIRVAWPDTEPALLRAVAGPYVEDFDRALADLMAAGLVWRLGDGRLGAGAPVQARAGWSAVLVIAAHHEVAQALAVGSEGRLRHLLAARVGPEEILAELPRVVADLQERGQDLQAIATLDLGCAQARLSGDKALECRLLLDRVDLALAQESLGAVERLLYELGRCVDPPPTIRQAEDLVKGVRLALKGESQRALEKLEGLGTLSSEALEVWRQGWMVFALGGVDRETEEQRLEALLGGAAGAGRYRGRVLGWLANLRYRQGRYSEAAELYAQSIEDRHSSSSKITALYSYAGSLLEAGRFSEAVRFAEEARARARAYRLASWEAKATWIQRAASYRLGRALAPSEDLVQSIRPLESVVEGLLALTEASIAARSGAPELSRRLCGVALSVFKQRNMAVHLLLAECLHRSVGGEGGRPVEELVALAEACPLPEIGAQALGLLGLAGADERLFQRARRLAGRLGGVPASRRLDVLSIAEACGNAGQLW